MASEKSQARGRASAKVLGQNAIPFLLHLAADPGWQAPSNVAKAIGGVAKYATALAERLAASGLVDLKPAGMVAGKPTHLVSINPQGREFVRLLTPVVEFLEGENKPPRRAKARRKRQ